MKGKKLFSLCVTLPIISFALLYGGGYIAQFIENYKIWTSAGGTPGNGSSPEMPTFAIGECFKTAFSFPYGIVGVGICALAIGLLAFMIMRMGSGDAGEFEKKNGSIICKVLTGLEKSTHIPDERNKQYYEKRPCDCLVYDAAKILEDYLNK